MIGLFWSKRQARTCGNHIKPNWNSNRCTQCTLPIICTHLKSNSNSRHNGLKNVHLHNEYNMNETAMAGPGRQRCNDILTWSSAFRKHFLPVYDYTSPGRRSATPGRGSAELLWPGPLVHSCPSIPKLEFRFKFPSPLSKQVEVTAEILSDPKQGLWAAGTTERAV